MAGFLDKVSGVITNTANDISDKAKEMSEVSALKGQVRSQEKIIENMYREIGKSYYEAHKEETEDPYAAQIQNITTAQLTIERLRVDIENVKARP